MKFPLCLLLLFSPAFSVAASGGRSALPDIIFVMVDDMGPADIGPYGQKAMRTPHLDRMAAEGILKLQIPKQPEAPIINFDPQP